MEQPPAPEPRRWRHGPRAASTMIPAVTRRAMAARGFAAARVLLDWDDIVGPALADATRPERLKRRSEGDADLILRVRPAMALEVEHLAPLIIERINSHFGFRAVTRLRLVQGRVPMRERTRAKVRPELSPADARALAAAIAPVADEDLREALAQLGSAVRAAAAAGRR